jgi:hypothetical protein
MLEEFKQLVEKTLTVQRIPRAMTIYQFLLGMVLALYVFFPAESFAFRSARSNADRSLASGAAATAVDLLAISGVAPSASRQATVGHTAGTATTSVGSCECAIEHGHPGHRRHRAHALWPADGRAQILQPQE